MHARHLPVPYPYPCMYVAQSTQTTNAQFSSQPRRTTRATVMADKEVSAWLALSVRRTDKCLCQVPASRACILDCPQPDFRRFVACPQASHASKRLQMKARGAAKQWVGPVIPVKRAQAACQRQRIACTRSMV